MNKKLLLIPTLGVLITLGITATAAEPTDYYTSALGKSRYELKTELHNIVKGQRRLAYGSSNCSDCVWGAFRTTDRNPDGTVRDIYTVGHCAFNFGYYADSTGYQCGTASKECDCYSREHSFPKSWWNATTDNGSDVSDTMFTDLNHLFPVDQYINGTLHNNDPLGEVGSVDSSCSKYEGKACISVTGYKRGKNKLAGYSGTVFEPIDEYKGYFARIYFYMATRYENRIAEWAENNEAKPMLNGTSTQCFNDWAKDMLVRWHNEHPVQDWERARNDSVYKLQYNRNPFIDHPELVNKIWGNDNAPFGETSPFGGYSIKYTLKKGEEVIEEKSLHIPGTEE
ncbi:MAG: endonuclease [Bacteroidales bacterium]|nr:endonuclease [Bacteroidales bacterium]